MIRKLNNKDFINFFEYLKDRNEFISAFNIKKLFRDCVQSRKTAIIIENDNKILGLLLITKEDNKNFLTIDSDNIKNSKYLLQVLFWNFKKEIYAKIKKSNKLGFLLKKFNFRIIDKKDDEFLMYCNPKDREKKYERINSFNYNKD